jgi:hypothetical protein
MRPPARSPTPALAGAGTARIVADEDFDAAL